MSNPNDMLPGRAYAIEGLNKKIHPWTRRELMRIENMLRCGLSYKDIAVVLHRSYMAVYGQVNSKRIESNRRLRLRMKDEREREEKRNNNLKKRIWQSN